MAGWKVCKICEESTGGIEGAPEPEKQVLWEHRRLIRIKKGEIAGQK
ncbi:MAG: hypothetical protein JRC90_04175 [Deltaproteobacteria bacterium]|nr:hypothetical protein [Deltaproteobacteria bacterium]